MKTTEQLKLDLLAAIETLKSSALQGDYSERGVRNFRIQTMTIRSIHLSIADELRAEASDAH